MQDAAYPPDECIAWHGYIDVNGYGRVFRRGTRGYAHRHIWTECLGPIPAGMVIDHLCRNRACVNPAHMEVVTPGENVLRGIGPSALCARQTHCKNGHPLSGENLLMRANGKRNCRTCVRARDRARWPEQSAKRRAKRVSANP